MALFLQVELADVYLWLNLSIFLSEGGLEAARVFILVLFNEASHAVVVCKNFVVAFGPSAFANHFWTDAFPYEIDQMRIEAFYHLSAVVDKRSLLFEKKAEELRTLKLFQQLSFQYLCYL